MHWQKRFVGPVYACWLLAVLLGCDVTFGPSLRGSGVATTETREAASFAEIDVGSGIQLDVKFGPAISLIVTGDDNLLPHLKTEITGDRLKIYTDTPYSSDLGVKVSVTLPALKVLAGSGASNTMLTDVAGEQILLDLSGASDCQFTGVADLIDVKLSGASHSTLAGAAKRLAVECSGASHVDAARLTARTVTAELSGASTAHVNATEELAAEASGASTLRYIGQPAKLDKEISGASTVAPE